MADKTEIRFFVLSEYEEEERYLNEKAKEGYLLEKVLLPGRYYFKKTEPVDMIYRIDFNPQKKEDWDSYIQMYKDYGWNYIQDLNEYSYFCKTAEESEEENEIFNDNQSRIDMMERIMKRKMFPLVAALAIFLLVNVLLLSLMKKSSSLEVVSVIYSVVCVLIIMLFTYLISRCIAGFSRLRRKYGIEE